jgi:hypothetical protein
MIVEIRWHHRSQIEILFSRHFRISWTPMKRKLREASSWKEFIYCSIMCAMPPRTKSQESMVKNEKSSDLNTLTIFTDMGHKQWNYMSRFESWKSDQGLKRNRGNDFPILDGDTLAWVWLNKLTSSKLRLCTFLTCCPDILMRSSTCALSTKQKFKLSITRLDEAIILPNAVRFRNSIEARHGRSKIDSFTVFWSFAVFCLQLFLFWSFTVFHISVIILTWWRITA